MIGSKFACFSHMLLMLGLASHLDVLSFMAALRNRWAAATCCFWNRDLTLATAVPNLKGVGYLAEKGD